MTDDASVRVLLELRPSARTISGNIAVQGGAAAGFYGWLELMEMLELASHGQSPGGALELDRKVQPQHGGLGRPG